MFSFQRIIASGKFIPEIDGLRFIAISSVVLFHLNHFISIKDTHAYIDHTNYSILNAILSRGYFGVELFFVISGFILALPFAKTHLNSGTPVDIKNYFLRRLTRLEPPYIIIITVLLFASVFVAKNLNFTEAVTSYLASVFYSHNIIYGKETFPLLNVVTWSLEIEVQFYILAPLLALVFKLNSALARRIIIGSAIILFTVLSVQLSLAFISLLNYMQYFLAGLLLADFYLTRQQDAPKPRMLEPVAIVCFLGIWFCNPKGINALTDLAAWKGVQLFFVLCFYYLVLVRKCCSFLRVALITNIGGMCYSIYLIHYPLISAIGNPLLQRTFSGYSYLNAGIVAGSLLLLVLISSAFFFLLVERPCMDKLWPQKFAGRLKQFLI